MSERGVRREGKPYLVDARTVDASDVSASSSVTYPDGTNVTSHPVGGERGLQPEGAQTGLDATTTGVKYNGKVSQTIDGELLSGAASVRLEAVTVSSNGDEVVTVEIYDETGAIVADSVSITGGGQASLDVTASLTAGNTVHVQWNVTTTSAGTAATFDAVGARLVVV